MSVGVFIFLIFTEQKNSTTDGFWEICEIFQNSYIKEHFQTATFEIFCESHPFLNKNAAAAPIH